MAGILYTKVDDDLHLRIKMHVTSNKTTISDWVGKVCEEALERETQKQPARDRVKLEG